MELKPIISANDPLEWHPYLGMQTKMLQTKAYECMAGGARGPGKTMAGLVWLIKPYLLQSSQVRSLVIRKNSEDLVDWLDRARYHYAAYGGVVSGKPAVIKFPSGYTIRTGHLKDDNAFTKYQGQEYQRILVEELTQIPTEKQYLQLLGSCRSTIPGIEARAMSTTNPGGIGHQWVKKRFVDPSVWGKVFFGSDTGRLRVFYPGILDDNPALMNNDPGYVKYLDGLKQVDIELWKAWRNGDWNVFSGMFFKNWRDHLHITPGFIPYPNSLIVGGMDWGRNSKPAHQAAFCSVKAVVEKVYYNNDYFHRVKIFAETAGKEKNVKEWAKEIKDKLKDFNLLMKNVAWTRGDPAMFTKGLDLSLSIADQFMEEGILIEPASNDRLGGWEALKKWFSLAPDGWPYLQIADNCRYLAASIPSLIYDEKKVEDLDSDGDDHGADAVRYMMKHLRWIDAHAGAVITDQLNSRPQPTIIVQNGKQQGLDLSPFERFSTPGTTNVIGGE